MAGVVRATRGGHTVVGALAIGNTAIDGRIAAVGSAGPGEPRCAAARAITGGRLAVGVLPAGRGSAFGALRVDLTASLAVAEPVEPAAGGEIGHTAGLGFGLARRHGRAAPFHARQGAAHARAVAGLFAAKAVHAGAREALVSGGAGLTVFLLWQAGLFAGAIARRSANGVAARTATGAAPGAARIAAQGAARDDGPRHAGPLRIADAHLARDPVRTRR